MMRRRSQTRFAALGLVLLFAPPILAADELTVRQPDYLIDVWDTERGLPHSTVTSIAQTPDGYLWVGTLHGGLARFDGARFVTFHPGNTPAFESIEVQRLLVDVTGKLWIGMVGGLLLSWDEGRFRCERKNPPSPESWIQSLVVNRSDEVVMSTFGGWLFHVWPQGGTNRWETFKAPDGDSFSAFCEERGGRIWYRTKDGGVGVFADQQFSRVPTNCGLASLRINTLTRDAEGHIWVGTDKEVAMWDGRQFARMTPTNGPPELTVRQLVFASDGSFWVREDTKLRKCVDRRWVREASPWQGNLRPAPRPIEMFSDREGGVWLTHYSDGLWHVDGEGHVARISNQEGLPTNQVECWFQDHEGNVWAGLSGGGLVRVRRRSFSVVWPAGSPLERAARSVCEDATGAMWFGTSGDSFLRWRDGQFTSVTPMVEQMAGRDGTVFPDAAGRVWLGSVGNGVWVFETNALWRPFPATGGGLVARALFADSQGRMWIGNDFGLFFWDSGPDPQLTPAPGFQPVFVSAITEDKNGSLWIGTGDGELCCYDPKAARSVRYKPAAGPAAVRFWALLADDDGVIWIGTLGGGLLRFKDGEFTRYATRDGLPNEHVSQILEGPRGDLWLGTRAGIARVSKRDLDQFARGHIRSVPCVTYGKFDGLPSVECSGGCQPGCWRSRDGRLWFATVKGIVNVQPRDIAFNPLPPPVVIEEVLVDGEVQQPKFGVQSPTAPARGSFPSRVARHPLVEIGPGRHNLEIHFTGLSFTAPDKVLFKYRLEGMQSEWVAAGNQRSVTYNFVPPGAYRFQVLACNNDGVWNEAGATLALIVRPYFWQTWWFKVAGLVLLVGGSGGAIGHFERRKARRKLERLQQQRALEAERARIAKDIHDDLGASLTRISLLSDAARSDLGDPAQTETSLARIAGTALELTRAMDEIVWAVNPKNDRLDSLVNYLSKFAQDFLGDAGLAYRLEVPPQLPRWPLGSQVRHNLFLAFKEALHNVVKHAVASEVHVALAMQREGFVLTVTDNGCGFRLDDPTATPGAAPGRLGGGNGLANMKSRLEEVGGQFEVQSGFGRGTTVRFVVPVKSPE
jgi:signal transduction histidine kinase/ligand-binding sensor domain-containing protein